MPFWIVGTFHLFQYYQRNADRSRYTDIYEFFPFCRRVFYRLFYLSIHSTNYAVFVFIFLNQHQSGNTTIICVRSFKFYSSFNFSPAFSVRIPQHLSVSFVFHRFILSPRKPLLFRTEAIQYEIAPSNLYAGNSHTTERSVLLLRNGFFFFVSLYCQHK